MAGITGKSGMGPFQGKARADIVFEPLRQPILGYMTTRAIGFICGGYRTRSSELSAVGIFMATLAGVIKVLEAHGRRVLSMTLCTHGPLMAPLQGKGGFVAGKCDVVPFPNRVAMLTTSRAALHQEIHRAPMRVLVASLTSDRIELELARPPSATGRGNLLMAGETRCGQVRAVQGKGGSRMHVEGKAGGEEAIVTMTAFTAPGFPPMVELAQVGVPMAGFTGFKARWMQARGLGMAGLAGYFPVFSQQGVAGAAMVEFVGLVVTPAGSGMAILAGRPQPPQMNILVAIRTGIALDTFEPDECAFSPGGPDGRPRMATGASRVPVSSV